MQWQYSAKRYYMVLGSKIPIQISSKACIYAAVLLMAVPFPWLLSWVIAAVWHELCHCIALILCSKNIDGIVIDVYGAKIHAAALEPAQTVFSALAGPLGGCLLIFLYHHFPRVSICALCQTIVNLLPIFPLDGGRALFAFFQMLFTETQLKIISNTIQVLILGVLTIISILSVFVWNLGLLPLILTVSLVIRTKKRKIPCK